MKKWYLSKTVWFNVIMTILGISAALAQQFPKWAAYLGIITVIGNVILRVWWTSVPIGTPPNS